MAFDSLSFQNTAFYTGAVTVALAATEAADVASVALTAAHTLALAATESADTASLALSAKHTATLTATEATDSAAISLTAAITASFAVTEPSDTATIISGNFALLNFAVTESVDSAAIVASVQDVRTVQMAAVEQSDIAAFSADSSALRRGGGNGKRRLRYLVYRNEEVTTEDAPPRRLKKRRVSPQLAAEVNALLPRFLGFTPEIIQAVLPETLYLPGSIAGEGDNIAQTLAAYLKRLDDEDEDDIELLLLAA